MRNMPRSCHYLFEGDRFSGRLDPSLHFASLFDISLNSEQTHLHKHLSQDAFKSHLTAYGFLVAELRVLK